MVILKGQMLSLSGSRAVLVDTQSGQVKLTKSSMIIKVWLCSNKRDRLSTSLTHDLEIVCLGTAHNQATLLRMHT